MNNLRKLRSVRILLEVKNKKYSVKMVLRRLEDFEWENVGMIQIKNYREKIASTSGGFKGTGI